MTDLGVDGVCEINGSGTSRKAHYLALGSENVELLSANFKPQVVEELTRISRLLLPVTELLQPSKINLVLATLTGLSLVLPVCCDTVFSPLVHLLGSNLDFNSPTLRANNSGVERLVKVKLRHRYVVLEATLQR